VVIWRQPTAMVSDAITVTCITPANVDFLARKLSIFLSLYTELKIWIHKDKYHGYKKRQILGIRLWRKKNVVDKELLYILTYSRS
jgi:hypothetical protein